MASAVLLSARAAEVEDAGPASCPPPPNPFDQSSGGADELSALADSMGMSSECKTAMSNAFSNSAVAASASASADTPFGGGQVSASFAASMSDALSESSQSGCQSSIMNLVKSNVAQNSSNCSLKDTKSSQKVNISANASISITQPSSCETNWAYKTHIATLRAQDKANSDALIARTSDPVKLAALRDSNRLMQEGYFEGVRLKNVKFRNSITAITNLKKSTSVQDKDNIRNSMESTANLQSENDIQGQTGVGGVPPTVRALTNSENTQNTNQNVQQISAIQEELEVNVNADGSVTMTSCEPIIMEDVDVDNDIKVKTVAMQMTKLARATGSSTAQKIMAEASSSTSTELEAAGLEDLAEALGNANQGVFDAGAAAARNAKLGNFKELAVPLIIAITLVVCVIIWKGADLLMVIPKASAGIIREVARNPLAMAGAIGLLVVIFALWQSGFFKFGGSAGGKKSDPTAYKTKGGVHKIESNAERTIVRKYVEADVNDSVQVYVRGQADGTDAIKVRNVIKRKVVILESGKAKALLTELPSLQDGEGELMLLVKDAEIEPDGGSPADDRQNFYY